MNKNKMENEKIILRLPTIEEIDKRISELDIQFKELLDKGMFDLAKQVSQQKNECLRNKFLIFCKEEGIKPSTSFKKIGRMGQKRGRKNKRCIYRRRK